MNCKHLRIRSKNYKKYFYCNHPEIKDKIDEDGCYQCKRKEYKEQKQINGNKHKRTEATSISLKTKQIVWERDKHKCIFCKRDVSVFFANAHYIKRSQGGKGLPENVFTACTECHAKQEVSEDMTNWAGQYLKSYYGDSWNKESLIYKKGEV